MHITILTYGSRGDVEPFIALGKGLQRRGHSIRLAAPEIFKAAVSSQGLEYATLAGNPEQLVQDLVRKAGWNPWRSVLVVSRYVLPLAESIFQGVRRACQGSDAVIHSFLHTQSGHQVAGELDVPEISAQVMPVFSNTADFPGVTFPDLPLGAVYRRLTHALTTQVFHLGGRLLYYWARRLYPYLPPLRRWPFSEGSGGSIPILYGFSRYVLPQPADWKAGRYVTGYWFLDPPEAWQPSVELSRFLDAGPPPVFIGFGSLIGLDARKLTGMVLDALKASRQRGVLGMGWGSLQLQDDLPKDVYLLDEAPYGWLFPRMAAVVHHGGSGTTGAGLRAGVPNVTIPFIADQPFWSRRVVRLGAGPKPIPARKLSAKALTEAILEAVGNDDMRLHAQSLGERIRGEEGVAQAVRIIEKYLALDQITSGV
jgi:sterol 3beta-glucosyltransferase